MEASILFPAFWALMPIFPQFMDLSDSNKIKDVGLARLSSLPGARSMKPEISKCMITQWKRLIEAGSREDGIFFQVEHNGKKWLPVFTDLDHFAAFKTTTPEFFGERSQSLLGALAHGLDLVAQAIDDLRGGDPDRDRERPPRGGGGTPQPSFRLPATRRVGPHPRHGWVELALRRRLPTRLRCVLSRGVALVISKVVARETLLDPRNRPP